MTEESFKTTVDVVSRAIDAGGVLILVVGLVVASGLFARAVVGDRRNATAYRDYRQRIGKTILLGLEFLVAADIIRTVAVDPTFRGVGVLAVIVVVRTFLSFALEVELKGQWPWQRAKMSPRDPRAAVFASRKRLRRGGTVTPRETSCRRAATWRWRPPTPSMTWSHVDDETAVA